MTIGACMLIYIEHDAEAAARDVVEIRAVDDNIAIFAIKERRKTVFGLRTGSIVKVANNSRYKSTFFFINCNFISINSSLKIQYTA